MGYEEGEAAVFDRNANGWIRIPASVALPDNQQDRDMLARELLVKFQMSKAPPDARSPSGLPQVLELTTIKNHLIDGEPDGIRVAGIGISTIQAMAFRPQSTPPRAIGVQRDRSARRLHITGSDDKYPDRMLAYIGEAKNVGDRLKTALE